MKIKKWRHSRLSTKSCAVLAVLGWQIVTYAQVTFETYAPNVPNAIGIGYEQVTGDLICSVNYPYGYPYNFEAVSSPWSEHQLSQVQQIQNELHFAIAAGTSQGFQVGQIFCGNGNQGEIVRITVNANGSTTVQNPWVRIPNADFPISSLYADTSSGPFGGYLIVATGTDVYGTSGGQIWRVKSDGTAWNLLATLNTTVEGLVTIPNDTTKYGTWTAGKILAAEEDLGQLAAIDQNGTVAQSSFTVPKPEGVLIVPSNENLYLVNFVQNVGSQILLAPASQFTQYGSDILIISEDPSALSDLKWNGTTYNIQTISSSTGSQWEQACFAPLPPPPPFWAIDIQFGPLGATQKAGAAAAGNPSDYWNQLLYNNSGDPPPTLPLAAQISCKDVYGKAISSAEVSFYSSDPSSSFVSGPSDALLDGTLESGGDDWQVAVSLPSGTYDIWLYCAVPYGNENLGADFQITSGLVGVSDYSSYNQSTLTGQYDINTYALGEQYVVFRNLQVATGTPLVINVSSPVQPFANGMQIFTSPGP